MLGYFKSLLRGFCITRGPDSRHRQFGSNYAVERNLLVAWNYRLNHIRSYLGVTVGLCPQTSPLQNFNIAHWRLLFAWGWTGGAALVPWASEAGSGKTPLAFSNIIFSCWRVSRKNAFSHSFGVCKTKRQHCCFPPGKNFRRPRLVLSTCYGQ